MPGRSEWEWSTYDQVIVLAGPGSVGAKPCTCFIKYVVHQPTQIISNTRVDGRALLYLETLNIYTPECMTIEIFVRSAI